MSERTDLQEAGVATGLVFARADVSLARLNVAILERQPFDLNAVRWSEAKKRARLRLADAQKRLAALPSDAKETPQ